MNRQQNAAVPRLHMGCGESLHSQWLLGTPKPRLHDAADAPRQRAQQAPTARSRTRG